MGDEPWKNFSIIVDEDEEERAAVFEKPKAPPLPPRGAPLVTAASAAPQQSQADADTRPCPFCAEMIKTAAVKCRFCGSDLSAPQIPMNMGPPAHFMPQPPPPPQRASDALSAGQILAVLSVSVVVLFVIGCAVWYSASHPSGGTPSRPADQPHATEPAQIPPSRAKSAMDIANEKLAAATTLVDALAAMPTRDSIGEMDQGTALLGAWSMTHLTWASVSGGRGYRFEDVIKDSSAARGGVTCWTGTISEIEARHSGLGTSYIGGLVLSNTMNAVRFIAVHDTTGVVADSNARLCGVVTGRFMFQNVVGGQTNAVMMVGMFDLPANRAWKP